LLTGFDELFGNHPHHPPGPCESLNQCTPVIVTLATSQTHHPASWEGTAVEEAQAEPATASPMIKTNRMIHPRIVNLDSLFLFILFLPKSRITSKK